MVLILVIVEPDEAEQSGSVSRASENAVDCAHPPRFWVGAGLDDEPRELRELPDLVERRVEDAGEGVGWGVEITVESNPVYIGVTRVPGIEVRGSYLAVDVWVPDPHYVRRAIFPEDRNNSPPRG